MVSRTRNTGNEHAGELVLICGRTRAFDAMGFVSSVFKAYWIKRLCNQDGTFKKFDFVTFSRGYTKTKFRAPFLGNKVVDFVDQKFSQIIDMKQFPPKKKGYFEISVGQPTIL